MSTFDGIVEEFPDIRIDYFRASNSHSRPPLAYFLSHVHSDHLNGLESCKSPFIYCSPATRDTLLRLEKYPHRMNFAKGILETRQQTYRHLKNLLKAIPIETPTVIELAPGNDVRVTLFDANHCVGAVMFLIEGNGKAVIYTGDIRSELWWVNSLTRHPVLLPYVFSPNNKPQKQLDCLYIDTTFVVTGREDPYRHFPSKSEGIQELLQKVAQYPADTLFYFDSWTFGYEDVWQAISTLLSCRIHVDDYKYGLYQALANGIEPKAPEAQKMIGFYCGNHFKGGCLTPGQSRIHSCEKGTGCEIWSKNFVRITPIVSRHKGVEIAELGAGGGHGDLNQQHELEVFDAQVVGQLMALCAEKLSGQTQLLSSVLQMLTSVINKGVQAITLENFIPATRAELAEGQEAAEDEDDDLPLEKLVPLLAKVVTKMKQKDAQSIGPMDTRPAVGPAKRADGLPKRITFPYSRHSSYNELCYLIEAFKPKNIHPCTVDEINWTPASSMSFLFGHIYETPVSFRHDQMMLKKRGHVATSNAPASRPISSSSASSEYATPDGDHAMTQSDLIQRPVGNGNGSRKLSEKQTPPKRKQHDRQAQGDFWPPLPVDHYSPHSDPRRRSDSAAPPVKTLHGKETMPWPTLREVDMPSRSPVQIRWRKRIAEARSEEQGETRKPPSKKRTDLRQAADYGRLSPPPGMLGMDDERSEDGNNASEMDHTPVSYEVRESSPPTFASSVTSMSVPFQQRLAVRQEARNAAIGVDGYSWCDIGLASVNGHQRKEEEL